jgi:hypothetical protein
MLKPEGHTKLDEDKVYFDEAAFLEIESSLEDSSFTSDELSPRRASGGSRRNSKQSDKGLKISNPPLRRL